MITIDSLSDPRVSIYRLIANPSALARAGLFVAESRWVVQRLLERPRFHLHSVLVTPAALRALTSAVSEDALCRAPIFVVEQTLMDSLVGFNIHRGCLALAHRPPVATLDASSLRDARMVVVLEGVNNPDNVGGIFRSAAAFGLDLVVLAPRCGDPLYRKAIRTSMAATLDVPYVMSGEWPAALVTMRDAGFRIIALTPHEGSTPLESLGREPRVALLLGTEGAGLSAPALEHADQRVRIRTTNRVDSLNVTVAASIALHHLATIPRTK